MLKNRFHWQRMAAAAALAGALGIAQPSAAAAPDAWITTKVKMALLADPDVPGTTVYVDTTDGRVTLHGTVATAAEKAKAEQVAKGVEGARAVRNQISVATAPADARIEPVADADLRTRVSEALDRDAALEGADIDVKSVDAGIVTLEGKAPTLSDHRRALATTRGVAGVRGVKTEIEAPAELSETEQWRDEAYDAAAYARSTASDLWLTSATKMRLLANAETPGFDINVDARDGVVTLFGVVDSQAAKQQAEAEVRKVDGVRSVRNDLQVVPAAEQSMVSRADAELVTEIEQRIAARPELGDDSIDVAVENGVAKLSGDVDGRRDRMAALTAARGVAGVRRVIDDLGPKPPAVGAR
jgi:hyperosmotically inducible protein